MESNELQKIWKSVDSNFELKSKEELNLLLSSKAKQTMNKVSLIIGFGIFSGVGLLTFLIITSLRRSNDVWYLINNISLGIIAVVSIFLGVASWYKLNVSNYNLPLQQWLEKRIYLLSKEFTGKLSRLSYYMLPLIYILTIFSIHVYYENSTFKEVMRNSESIMGLLVGTPIGLFVAYLLVRKIKKFQLQNLNFLKETCI